MQRSDWQVWVRICTGTLCQIIYYTQWQLKYEITIPSGYTLHPSVSGVWTLNLSIINDLNHWASPDLTMHFRWVMYIYSVRERLHWSMTELFLFASFIRHHTFLIHISHICLLQLVQICISFHTNLKGVMWWVNFISALLKERCV